MTRIIDVSPKKRAVMGRAGRRKVEIEFDKEMVVNRYLTAANQAIAAMSGRV